MTMNMIHIDVYLLTTLILAALIVGMIIGAMLARPVGRGYR
jgi:hypothetical protein